MRVARLRIEGFRGIRTGEFSLRRRSVLVGPNGCGKSTIVDAISLVLGRSRMVKQLTEHDFTASDPQPADRIRIVATVTGFSSDDPDQHGDWFRMGRAVPKWVDNRGKLHATAGAGRTLAAQIAFAARFDHEELSVEVRRYFHDDDDLTDPFADDLPAEQIPGRLLNGLGYFVLPARRSWEGVASFNSDLFRRTVSDAAGIPASEILAQRDDLRRPAKPIESAPALADLVGRMNDQLARLMIGQPKFQLRVTSGDSEAVLQSLLPHYTTSTGSLPASRHGMGLVSLQSLLLLLEVGRARKAKGLSFILALEEPELHLAPGLQVRLLTEAVGLADQMFCTTHSPRVAAMVPPTDVYVMATVGGVGATTPLLEDPLPQTASNNERRLFLQNRVRVVEALMHPRVVVPEGRFDAEWLLRLAEVGEVGQSVAAPFTTVVGIVPTENAAVVFTTERLRKLRPGIIALVDGDPAGDSYVQALASVSPAPQVVFQWPRGWTVEDVVSWVLEAGGQPVIDAIGRELAPAWNVPSLADLTRLLKTPNDSKNKILGLKEDVIVHDLVMASLRESAPCVKRAAELCDCLVQVAIGATHPRALPSKATGTVSLISFDPS